MCDRAHISARAHRHCPFRRCGSARSEQANAATNKSADRLSFWKLLNRHICWIARCPPLPRFDSTSRSAPIPGSSTARRVSALSREALHLSRARQVSARSEIFLHRASRATSFCQFVALYFRRVSLTCGISTLMTKVCTDDRKFAARSCPDRRLFVAPYLTS